MRQTTKESKGSKGGSSIVYVAEAGIRGGANARLKKYGRRGRGRMGRYRQPKRNEETGDVRAVHIHGVEGVTLGRRGLGDEAHVKGGRLAKRKTRGNVAYFGSPPTPEHSHVHLHRIRTIGGRRSFHRLGMGRMAGFGVAKAAALAAREAARAARTAAAAAATMAKG